jgi:hypothetical protein
MVATAASISVRVEGAFPELRRNPSARANEFLVKQIGKWKWRGPHSDLGSETAVDTLAAYRETGKRDFCDCRGFWNSQARNTATVKNPVT